jgi:hypothetical protein
MKRWRIMIGRLARAAPDTVALVADLGIEAVLDLSFRRTLSTWLSTGAVASNDYVAPEEADEILFALPTQPRRAQQRGER